MPEEDFLEANDAVKYLAKRWGIESYSLEAFRMLRYRHHIKPALSSRTSTFWRKSDLDKIPKPDRHKARGPRLKKSDVAVIDPASMMLKQFGKAPQLEGSEPDALIA